MKRRTIYTLPADSKVTGKVLSDLITKHKDDVTAFTRLDSYISGDQPPIMDREAPNTLLTINDFAGYIVKVNTGYLLGTPVTYRADNNVKEKDIIALTDAYRNQNIDTLDTDLADDLASFGKAFEFIYTNEDSDIKSAKLSVFNTIMVYDDTVKHDKLFAVNYQPMLDKDGKQIDNNYFVTVYNNQTVTDYELKKEAFAETDSYQHNLGYVPVIEYWNNKRLLADPEPVLTLIDAYNILQSDRVLDREKLVDAILAVYGATMTDEQKKALKESRAISLPDGSNIKYVTKDIDEADADVLRKTLADDIHKFSFTPDMTDKEMGSNSSGVALAYKLILFEWNISNKEAYFKRGLSERIDIYSNFLKLRAKSATLTSQDVQMIFRRSLPKNDLETSQIIDNLVGLVDKETLISQLSFVENAKEVLEKVDNEDKSDPDDISNFEE